MRSCFIRSWKTHPRTDCLAPKHQMPSWPTSLNLSDIKRLDMQGQERHHLLSRVSFSFPVCNTCGGCHVLFSRLRHPVCRASRNLGKTGRPAEENSSRNTGSAKCLSKNLAHLSVLRFRPPNHPTHPIDPSVRPFPPSSLPSLPSSPSFPSRRINIQPPFKICPSSALSQPTCTKVAHRGCIETRVAQSRAQALDWTPEIKSEIAKRRVTTAGAGRRLSVQ